MVDFGGWVTAVVERFGYAGLAFLVALENLVPPIPSEVVLPLAGFAASRGTLTYFGAVLAATTGSVVGALAIYEMGRRVGSRRVRGWMERHGRWLLLEGEDVDRAQVWFDRHGASAVLFGRLVPGVRSYVSFPAGFSTMPLWRFVLYTALGSAVWNGVLVGLGLLLGAQWHVVSGYVGSASRVVWLVLGLLVAGFALHRWRKARAERGPRRSGRRDRA